MAALTSQCSNRFMVDVCSKQLGSWDRVFLLVGVVRFAALLGLAAAANQKYPVKSKQTDGIKRSKRAHC